MPLPPSLVALPPMARITRRAPASSAAEINWPVPSVLVTQASRCARVSSCRPLAMAISMIAVLLSASQPHWALTGAPSGPLTLALISSPLQAASSASMVPSPPSAIGHLINSACGQTSARPLAIASATAWALRLSLNESGAMTIFIVVLQIRCSNALIQDRACRLPLAQ